MVVLRASCHAEAAQPESQPSKPCPVQIRSTCSDSLNRFAKFLARFEEGNSLRWHFDSGSGFWIACDARSSLARVEASESADFHLVAGSKGADDAVKYGANDDGGFLPGDLNGVVNLVGQIGPGHRAHLRCITKESSTLLP